MITDDLRTQNNLRFASQKVLTSLAKFVVEFGMTYPEFEQFARQAFVDSQADLTDTDPKQEAERIADLIGLSYEEVESLLTTRVGIVGPDEGDMIAPADALAVWHTDPDFLDEQGKPKPLLYKADDQPSFVDLVEQLDISVPPIITLKALLLAGVVIEQPNGMLVAVQRTYVPKNSQSELVHRFGRTLLRLLKTLNHNVAAGENDPRLLEFSTTSRWYPRSKVVELQNLIREKALETINHIDDQVQSNENRHLKPEELCEVGLGMYYFCLDDEENVLIIE